MRASSCLLFCLLVLAPLSLLGRAVASGTDSPIALGPEGGWITALAASPTFGADGRLWAATFGGRIFAATGPAVSWSQSSTGETDPVVEGLAASPVFAQDHTVFAAADEGVFKSTDGGAGWSLSSAGLGHHYCRAVLPSTAFASDHTLFAATDAGVYRSTDGGAGWLPPSDTRSVISLSISSNAGSPDVYAGLDGGGLEVSHDAGANWQNVSSFPAALRALSLLSAGSSGTLLTATDNGIWRSADGGSTWSAVGAAGDRVDTLAAVPGGPIFAGSGGGHGVYRSDDAGATWTIAGAPGFPYVTALAATPGALLAGTAGNGVWSSADGGKSWTQASSSLDAFGAAALEPATGGLLVGGNGGLFQRDVTSGWHALPLPSRFVTSLAVRGAAVFAGTQDHGLQISHDGAGSWSAAAAPGSAVSRVGLSPPTGTSFTVLLASDFLYRSIDGGQTFSKTPGMVGGDVRSFAFSPGFAHDGTAFAGTVSHGLYRSTDGGGSWQQSSAGLPSAPVLSILTSDSFARDGTVYAATAGKGIYLSSDGGASWSPLSPAIPDALVTALTWTSDGRLLAGTEHGVFELTAGAWSQLGNGWNGYVSALVDMVEGGSEDVYLGTTGWGVWELTLGPVTTSTSAPTVATAAVTIPTVALPPSPTPAPSRVRTRTPTPRPTVAPHPFALRLRTDPAPLAPNWPALLSVSGPVGTRLSLRLEAHAWQRLFSGVLGKDGRAAFGFVSPPSTVTITARGTLRGKSVAAKLIVPVRGG